jgi:diacylglycerol kinase (ATP)
MKPGKTGLSRLIDATGYSMKGFRAAWTNEAAFRQELVAVIILLPAAVFIARTITQFLLLVLPLFILLIAELVNSALEAVVDRIGDEHHELSGRAKDMGSATVFVALALAFTSWLLIVLQNYVL